MKAKSNKRGIDGKNVDPDPKRSRTLYLSDAEWQQINALAKKNGRQASRQVVAWAEQERAGA